jgi:hypothetical protein
MRGRVGLTVEANARPVSPARSPQAAFQRVMLAVALVVLALGAGHEARAQTTPSTPNTSNTSPLTPLTSPNGVITLSPNSNGIERLRDPYTPTRPWWISYDDCVNGDGDGNGDVFTFSLSTTASNDNLEVWVGTENCATNRNNLSLIGQCWMVGLKNLNEDTVQVEVPVRSVLARRTGVASLPGPLGPEICDNSNQVNGEAISWYFMVVRGGQASEYIVWSGEPGGTGIDVVGPAPPGRISVGVGERQLSISMDDVPTDATRQRYEAFCVPAGATGDSSPGEDAGINPSGGSGGVASPLDAGDASVSLDAGGVTTGEPDAGDPSAAPAACFTELLRVGARPPTDDRYSCGTTNAISGTLRTKGNLVNYQPYAVAVSGQDELGNAGVVSEIQCGTPRVLEDFYELYKNRGGPGGGGFCSVSPQAGKTGVGAASVLLMALAGLGWRRSRGRA